MAGFVRRLVQSSVFRYGAVGLVNTAVGYGSTLLLLLLLNANFVVSTVIGNVLGLACSYVLNRKFTFASSAAVLPTVVKFGLSFVVCYSIAYWLASAFLGTGVAAATLGAVLYTVLGYIANRYFVFPKRIDTP